MNLLEENKYNITIENFEGPLDLLCHLISKNKMNIFDISLSSLTDKYIEYLKEMQELNLEVATEFLVMASNLLYLKSKKLLPITEPEEDEIEEMTEEELINRILEYKQYKENLDEFKKTYGENFGTFEKEPEKIKIKRQLEGCINLDLKEIQNIYFEILDRNKGKVNIKAEEVQKIVTYEKITIRSKVKQIFDIFKKKTSFIFSKVYNTRTEKKIDIVTAFLSVLELSRLKHVDIKQQDMFGDIVVKNKNMKNLDLSLIKE
ncbi:MAG: segregation/condensation protein A [Clostridia bacterium]|nr:segregation/condensation protein A [Clostridia bacterium]